MEAGMQRMFVLAGVTTMLAAGALVAQSDSDYQAWMKSNGATMQALQKAIAAKDGSAVAADGKTFQETFKQVGDFWQKRNADDAVSFAKKAQAAAEAISKSGTRAIWTRLPRKLKTSKRIAVVATWHTESGPPKAPSK